MQFEITYRPFYSKERTSVIVTTHPAPGKPGYWYATAPGAGCSKDYEDAQSAATVLVNADLGEVWSTAPCA